MMSDPKKFVISPRSGKDVEGKQWRGMNWIKAPEENSLRQIFIISGEGIWNSYRANKISLQVKNEQRKGNVLTDQVYMQCIRSADMTYVTRVMWSRWLWRTWSMRMVEAQEGGSIVIGQVFALTSTLLPLPQWRPLACTGFFLSGAPFGRHESLLG